MNRVKGFIKRYRVWLILLAVVLFFVLRGKGKEEKDETTQVQKQTITETVTASGETDIRNGEAVYSQVSASVKEIKLKSGTPVSEGDVILLLDSSSLQAASSTAYTAYLTAVANQTNSGYEKVALKEAVEAKRLLRDAAQEDYNEDDSFENKQALQTAESSYQTAIATLNSERATEPSLSGGVNSTYFSYLSAFKNLQNAVLKAPSSGTLALEDVKVGELISSGDRLFSIVNSGSIIFSAEVDETEIGQVEVGKKTSVLLDSSEERISGEVLEVLGSTHTTDGGSTAVRVIVKLSGNKLPQIIGLNGEAEIEIATKENTLVIPVEYLEEDETGEFVWKVENCVATKTYVKIGISSFDFIEITEGLNEQSVVSRGENPC